MYSLCSYKESSSEKEEGNEDGEGEKMMIDGAEIDDNREKIEKVIISSCSYMYVHVHVPQYSLYTCTLDL